MKRHLEGNSKEWTNAVVQEEGCLRVTYFDNFSQLIPLSPFVVGGGGGGVSKKPVRFLFIALLLAQRMRC